MFQIFRKSLLSVVLLAAASLSLLPSLAFATVTTNGAAATNTIGGNLAAGTPQTYTYTVPSGTDTLTLSEGSCVLGGGTTPPPTAVTYNGVAMTMVPGSSKVGASCETSIWFLLAPPTGAADTVSLTYGEALNAQASIVQPLVGVLQSSPVGTAAIATGAGTTASVTASGTARGLYLGLMMSAVGTTSTSGLGQTSLAKQTSRASIIAALDDVLGGTAGAFSWTVTSGEWEASAVEFLPVPALADIGQAPWAISRHIETPTTGFSIAAGTTELVLLPAGTLASGTIILPPHPGINQPFMVMTSQTITALTVTTSDGATIAAAPTTLSNTSAIKLVFEEHSNTWLREQ